MMQRMRRTAKFLLALLSLAAFSYAASKPSKAKTDAPNKSSGAAAPAPAANSQGQMPEVIIKGGDKSGVKSEKPPLNLDMDVDETVRPALGVEEEPLKRQPESLRNPRAG